MNGPIHSSNIDVSNVTFQVGQAKAGRNPSITMRYNGNSLLIRLPRVGYPGGCLVREGDNGMKTYTLIGSLKGTDPYGKERSAGTDDIGKLYNLLTDLENHIIKAAVENSTKWFGKKRSEEAIRDAFKRILSFSVDKVDGEYVPNGKYPPSFRVKVPVYEGRVSTEIVDASRNPVTYVTPESLTSIFPKGVEANLAVSGSIYVIAGGGFGVTWRLTAAQVFPQMRRTAAQMFDDESGAPPTIVEDENQTAQPDENQVPNEDSEYGAGSQAQQVTEQAQAPASAPAGRQPRRRPAAGAGVP
uniref:Uncharacterized protein n=1 Tax=viral metagenome TaxID=1070528 RepID=A0A6C0DQK6_9ZZZZ